MARPLGEPLAPTRRSLLRAVPGAAAAYVVAGCHRERQDDHGTVDAVTDGRLAFRPPNTAVEQGRSGWLQVPLSGGDPALAHVPQGTGPLRLVLLLHGAGGVAESALRLLQEQADERRLLLVALKSVAATWDVIAGGFGPDVRRTDELLGWVASRYPVDGWTVAGFSDGASYALTIGQTNGDVFDSVVSFSPGFTAARARHGRPRIFVSHGVEDRVLPIERCSRRIVPALRDDGYDVTYREFAGGHSVPPAVRRVAVEWLGRG